MPIHQNQCMKNTPLMYDNFIYWKYSFKKLANQFLQVLNKKDHFLIRLLLQYQNGFFWEYSKHVTLDHASCIIFIFNKAFFSQPKIKKVQCLNSSPSKVEIVQKRNLKLKFETQIGRFFQPKIGTFILKGLFVGFNIS